MTLALSDLQKLLLKIPAGKVITYKEAARALGNPKASRAIGTLCGKNPELDVYPCFRVVRSNGEIGGFAKGPADKIRRLKAEGIDVKNGKIVDLKSHLHFFKK